MKIIGLVGGTGWISTVEYYRIINEETHRRLGRLQFAECILYSLNFGDVQAAKEAGRESDIFVLVRDAAKKVEDAGADCLLICANTMHKFADDLAREIRIPIVHIAEATGREISGRGIKKVGLLGTKLTMELDFYKKKLAEQGIETLVPDELDRNFIDGVIFREIMKGILNPESRMRFLEIIWKLTERGAEGVILGCTEIPLLVKQEHTEIPLFDTLDIHAKAAVDFALAP